MFYHKKEIVTVLTMEKSQDCPIVSPSWYIACVRAR